MATGLQKLLVVLEGEPFEELGEWEMLASCGVRGRLIAVASGTAAPGL